MIPYEYLLSESQERMLFVVAQGREQEIISIFERWGLHAVVAGQVIADPIVRILFRGQTAAEIPALALAENTPLYHRELLPKPLLNTPTTAWSWTAEVASLLRRYRLCHLCWGGFLVGNCADDTTGPTHHCL
jgi:phosphoribosylformylglycinamidine (FGAM) synthase-like enzyme